MEQLINRTIKPFLMIAGLATTGIIGLVVNPEVMLPLLFQLPYQESYSIIVQHWGFMITLVGISMIGAAFVPSIRTPVLLFALIEKLGLLILGLVYIHAPETKGFVPAIIMDSLISLYLIVYFIQKRDY